MTKKKTKDFSESNKVDHNQVLLSTASFPPVQYFSKFLRYNKVYLEQHENFPKQTYRNRYEIFGANGLLTMVIPVVKGRGRKINIRELLISYDTDWQRNHWRAIFSSYNSSPFFEYYQDDIRPFFEKKHKFLFDFNMNALMTICELTEMESNINFTPQFETVPENTLNLREALSPKAQKAFHDADFKPVAYTQVFSDRFGFIPNLSILDLLFNEGPNSINILNLSCRK